ncbi:MAG: thioredoxin 2 [Solirubrobacterales bacterium]|jgi:thioredoxin 2|nr:thioredoxin 2 [Solirubrobacterales bacterium]
MATPIVTCPNCGKKNRLRPAEDGVPRCGVCHHLLPWLVDATADDFERELKAPVPVLVDFWAPWCGPCKWISPAVAEQAQARAGKVKVVKLDIDTAPEIASRFGVQGIPTLMLVRDGDEVDRLVGAAPKPQLESWLENHLAAGAT